MQFFYFVPAVTPQITLPELAAAGLGYLGIKGKPTATGVGNGPIAGVQGLVFSGDGTAPARYKPADQKWVNGPGGKYAVGYSLNEPLPGPADLQKPRVIDGEAVEIGLQTQQAWTIPICRSIVRGSTLPKRLILGPDLQTWSLGDLPEFLTLCADAERVWNVLAGPAEKATETGLDQTGDMAWEESAPIAVRALAVNYRVSPIEVSLLDLLTTEAVHAIFEAMVDFPILRKLARSSAEKKETSDTSPIAAGVTA